MGGHCTTDGIDDMKPERIVDPRECGSGAGLRMLNEIELLSLNVRLRG